MRKKQKKMAKEDKMMFKPIKSIVGITVILSLLLGVVYAGDVDRVGTASGVQVQIPVGARNIAMGGADLGTAKSIEAIYWNPAGLSMMEGRTEAMFSNMSYIADIGVTYFAVGLNAGKLGNIAASVKNINFGEILQTSIDDPDGDAGTLFSPTFATVGLTWAKVLTNSINFGITTKIIYESIPRASASAVGFDLGLQYRNLVSVEGLCLGLAIKNLGTDMVYSGSALLTEGRDLGSSYDDFRSIPIEESQLPSSIEISLSKMMTFGGNSLLVSGNFVNNNVENDNVILGAEFKLMDMIFLRGGYRSVLAETGNNDMGTSVFGMALGGGIQYQLGNANLRFDYSYRPTEYFQGNNVFSVAVGF